MIDLPGGRRALAPFGRALAAAGALSLSLALFALVAMAVVSGRAAAFDRACRELALRPVPPAAAAVLSAASAAGELPVVCAAVAAAALWLWRRGDGRAARQLVLVAAFAEALNLLLKQLFHRARPPLSDLATYAFPSGHAMAAMATYGMIAVLAARARPGLRRPLAAAAGAAALLVGVSRVFLGFHWASDVVGGAAAGAAVLIAASWLSHPSADGVPRPPC